MNDASDHPPADDLGGLVDTVVEQVAEIETLDSARAEAWASDVLAYVAESDVEPGVLFAALEARGGDSSATALSALSGVAEGVPSPAWHGPRPMWVDAIGTSRCEGAWLLRGGDAVSIAFRFVDALDESHVVTVDLLPGPPETVGEVIVGPGDLLDALHEDDADLDSEAVAPAQLADRCAAALRMTGRPALSAVVNGRLLLRRLAGLTTIDIGPPTSVAEELPDLPDRDPEDDAFALDVFERAVGPRPPTEHPAVAAVAELVAPADLEPFTPAQRDAVLILEWADWLGAAIGLLRAGEGCQVDGCAMVDMVNRCPEVTTTIPKSDRARIEWAFGIVVEAWAEIGLVADGRLTALAVEVVPAALRRAWS